MQKIGPVVSAVINPADLPRYRALRTRSDIVNYAGKLYENTVDSLRELTKPRPSFEVIADQERAMNRGGFLLNGFLTRAKNFFTGETEHIYRNGETIQRVIYDSNGIPVLAIEFNKTPDGHFIGCVLSPFNGHINRYTQDGSSVFYRDVNYFDEFNIKEIQPSV